MKLATVEDLISGDVRVTRSCQWCKEFADVDLQRILREKGADYGMLDHLPLCTNGDCKGMIRFQAHRGMRTQWLLTKTGYERFDKHSVWMFETHIIETRRQDLKQRRASAGLDSEQ
ncbi:hypothetical protein [Brevundimonas naejangsanensis]|uniref:hypothetical protein n=1 Tax=Brevundimonas naejangsanensis TaxID=588932 RepID=UPI003D025B15